MVSLSAMLRPSPKVRKSSKIERTMRIEAAFSLNPGWGLVMCGVYTYLNARDLSRNELALRRLRH
jgi:hypothetical protein